MDVSASETRSASDLTEAEGRHAVKIFNAFLCCITLNNIKRTRLGDGIQLL